MLFLNTFINTKQNYISVSISVRTAFYNNLPSITFATKLYKILKIKGGWVAMYTNVVYVKNIRPSDLTNVQCLWSNASFFTPDQNVRCVTVRFWAVLFFYFLFSAVRFLSLLLINRFFIKQNIDRELSSNHLITWIFIPIW